MAGKRKPKTERFFETSRMSAAFVAAVRYFGHEVWESPEGEAIVRDVQRLSGGRYRIVYRLIATWGKEAW
jgi:hypothetical protein